MIGIIATVVVAFSVGGIFGFFDLCNNCGFRGRKKWEKVKQTQDLKSILTDLRYMREGQMKRTFPIGREFQTRKKLLNTQKRLENWDLKQRFMIANKRK